MLKILAEIVLEHVKQHQETVLEIHLEIQDVNSMKKETISNVSFYFILNFLNNSPLALNHFQYQNYLK